MAKILVVDDAQFLRLRITKMLTQSGHDTLEAENGRQAYDLYTTVRPDVVLMDVTMPEMDGHEVLLEVRSNPELSHLPFIFLTASADRDSMRQGRKPSGPGRRSRGRRGGPVHDGPTALD